MLDRAELGKALAAHPGDTEAALAQYEQGAVCHRAIPSRPAAPDPTPGAPPKGRGTGAVRPDGWATGCVPGMRQQTRMLMAHWRRCVR
ncbi:hypothetical protein SUDANB19_00026 [Streptomyces sp. enrichment culture]